MVKIICDRCGKEIPVETYDKNKKYCINKVTPPPTWKDIHLCPECEEKFDDFLVNVE